MYLTYSVIVFVCSYDFVLGMRISSNANKGTNELSKLFEELGITPYLLKDECNVDATLTGWTPDRPLNASFPALPDNMNCHLENNGTGFSCCLSVPLLKRSFSFYLDLDSCNYQLSAGIEKLADNLSLLDYEFGRERMVDLFGVIQLSYTIVDVTDVSVFELTADIGVCVGVNLPCNTLIPLLEKLSVPKPLCNWQGLGFKTSK